MKTIILFLTAMSVWGFAQNNVTFLSNLNEYSTEGYNDIWGYVDGNNIEYALLGCGNGTSIIRIDNPTSPQEVVFIPGPSSSWRDIKTHGTYAYIVTEGTGTGRGLQIVDLSQLPVTATLVNTLETWFTRAHNIFIDDGYAYVIGTDNGGGMHILDLSNPTNPIETDYYTGSGYIHDVYVWDDTVVACAGSSQIYDLIDVTNKSNPQLISSSLSLPGIYAHSGWMTEDKRYFIACEEFNVRDITVWDLVDRTDWDLVVSTWELPTGSSIIHNLFVKGNFAHISYYTSGYVVLDISDPSNPVVAGQYDTYPANDGGTYNGAWGCFPYLPSGNTIISDIQTGLYVLHFDGEVQTFQLSVNVADGWNMVSVPGINPGGMGVDTWWSGKEPTSGVFKYDGGYTQVTTTTPTEGYWMKNVGAQVYNYTAIEAVPHNPIPCSGSWNLIGIYEDPVGTANMTGIIPPVYGYFGGYQVVDTLLPGYGYYVRCNGSIIVPESPGQKSQLASTKLFKEDWGKIILTDASGINYTLYAVTGQVNLDKYELPPMPPAGMFDIRYGSGRIAEDINSSIQDIQMTGVTYPLTIRVEGMDMRLMDESGKTVNVNLKSGEEVVISDATIQKLMVTGELVPTEYALEQNYPNPFNPSTTINFSLPKTTDVTLTIYNTLGEKITELVRSRLEAGKYSFEWNAQNIVSGIYIYELKTNNVLLTKKMVLLK